jgi:hypothetical protein
MREGHQLLALKVLFTEEEVTLITNSTKCEIEAEKLTRIGIVQVRDDGKPHFIHRTFAEYYVADYLVNHLTGGNKTSKQVRTFILENVFQKADYRVVRVFIDGLLPRFATSEQGLKEYGNEIHGLCKDSQIDNDNGYDLFDSDPYYFHFDFDYGKSRGDTITLFHRAVHEGYVNIIGFFLESAQASEDPELVNKLLLEKDRGCTAWHRAVISDNIQILDKLWQCPEKNPRAHKIRRDMLFVKERTKKTAGNWQ